ncbi:MAG: SpoVR family protein [Legionellales bacterium]|nr:SpoVR family protein [Legionellales bacterium]
MKRNVISTGSEWSFELLDAYDKEIARIAESYRLDTFPNQLEVISAEQMLDAYASHGMPLGYAHWSYGKQLVNLSKNYQRGAMGLAYEIVINSNPCIAYLMEENTMAMQALVIAHACYGHNSFFKNNYLFQIWTNPDSIIDYLLFAKNYIHECEELYGVEAVETIIDACHALSHHGVDRYKHPPKLSLQEERDRQKRLEEYRQSQYNDLWRTIPQKQANDDAKAIKRFPEEPQENILYFIEKNAPLLEPWQREIVRIVRKIAQYFYPQRQTKVMNEGWATFWHYRIINDLYDQGSVTDEFMIENLQSHTNVIYQPPFDSKYYSGINPYTLGYAIFTDLRRICDNPTAEDQDWFPHIAHSDWVQTLDFAMRNFKDESFIAQYLSPRVIRDLKLFCVLDDDELDFLEISAIHNKAGYQHVRSSLAEQYNLGSNEPNIEVYNVDTRGNRSLTLRHHQYNRKPLAATETQEVLKHLHTLWGFDVHLESVDHQGKIIKTFHCPEKSSE